jgi:hypothetical protein
MLTYYLSTYGVSEADLGAVAVTLRANAGLNENATMRRPLSVDDYLASRDIVRPIRLLDMCLVNDGAVCVILTGADRARALPHAPVLVSGWGNAHVRHSKMHMMVRERLHPQLAAADTLRAVGGHKEGDAYRPRRPEARRVEYLRGSVIDLHLLASQQVSHVYQEPPHGGPGQRPLAHRHTPGRSRAYRDEESTGCKMLDRGDSRGLGQRVPKMWDEHLGAHTDPFGRLDGVGDRDPHVELERG